MTTTTTRQETAAPMAAPKTKPIGKAPAPRGKRKHKKPQVPREAVESVAVAKTMYAALLAEGAPKAGPMGYVLGACTTVKILIDQACQQGEDRGELRRKALEFIASI